MGRGVVTAALNGVIALDGPSGTGKTTAARTLAARLDAAYLDTGAMYRVVALAVLRAGVDPSDAEEVLRVAHEAEHSVGTDPARAEVRLDGRDVAAAIREAEVDTAVSPVSALPAVRELLVAEQRRIIAQVLDEVGGVVVDGRDIGTVVVPAAPLKVFLTASAEARAARRSAQNSAEGRESTVESVRVAVERRDHLDSTRKASPLRAAEDAVRLDTSELDREQVIAALIGLARDRGLLDAVGAEAVRR